MFIPAHIRRIVLAVLLILPVWTAMTSTAAHGCDVPCKVFRAAEQHTTGDVSDYQHMPLQDAVLSGAWWTSLAPCVPQGNAGGTGFHSAYYPANPFLDLRHQAGQTARIGRWRLLSASIHRDQLQALYPAHGFW
jgi:hypothetical protein